MPVHCPFYSTNLGLLHLKHHPKHITFGTNWYGHILLVSLQIKMCLCVYL